MSMRLDTFERARKIERNRRLACRAACFVLALSLAVGGWMAGRRADYSLQYEDMVRATVRDMVTPEALRVQP